MRALLFSNSVNPNQPYLAHIAPVLKRALPRGARVAFVPFAGVRVTWNDYLARVRAALSPCAFEIESVHVVKSPSVLIGDADGVMVGGGNTFRLLHELRARKLLGTIKSAVLGTTRTYGATFVGWSAGSNIAAPTICTTNDMPIVDPQGFGGLGLVPFQINPHYNNALPPGHQGETREERIIEFLALNPKRMVVGLPEGDWLDVRDEQATLCGPHPAQIFQASLPPTPLAPRRRVPLGGSAAALRGRKL
jgi:dipeptidase E